MIKCPNCGKRNSDDNKFCGECGAKLPPPQNYCPMCDITFKKGEKFCTQCGHILVNESNVYSELERLEKQRLEQKRLKEEKEYIEKRLKEEEEYMKKLKKRDPKKYNEIKSRSEVDNQHIEKWMYDEIDDDAYLKWSKDNDINQTKEEFINRASKCLSKYELDAHIYTINRYENLLNNKQKLNEYDKLFKALKHDSLTKLREYKNLKYRKGLLLLEYVEKYSIDEICDIINNFDKK